MVHIYLYTPLPIHNIHINYRHKGSMTRRQVQGTPVPESFLQTFCFPHEDEEHEEKKKWRATKTQLKNKLNVAHKVRLTHCKMMINFHFSLAWLWLVSISQRFPVKSHIPWIHIQIRCTTIRKILPVTIQHVIAHASKMLSVSIFYYEPERKGSFR